MSEIPDQHSSSIIRYNTVIKPASALSTLDSNSITMPTMEYNDDVEEMQDEEYPMLQGKIDSLAVGSC